MRDPFPGEVVLNGSSQARIHCTRSTSSIAPIASSHDLGNVSMAGAGISRPHTRFQTSLTTKVWSHHRRQRPRVRRLTPNHAVSFAARTAVMPWRIAEARTTTAAG